MSELFNRDIYFFGEPLDSEIGKIRFLTYKEHLLYRSSLYVMSLNVLHIYYQEIESLKRDDIDGFNRAEKIKEDSLYSLVRSNMTLLRNYLSIFELVLENEDAVVKVFENEEEFMKYRALVMDMNMVSESLVSPNPEIQKGIERKRRHEASKNKDEKITCGDIISTIAVGSGIEPSKVSNMTILLVYSIYYRISKFQNYSTSALFATVAEKVEIESYAAHINLWEEEQDGIEKTEFNRKYGNIF